MDRPSDPSRTSTLVVAALVFYGLMSLGALLAFSLGDLDAGEVVFGLPPQGAPVPDAPPEHRLDGLLGIGTGLGVVAISWLLRNLGPMDRMQREFSAILGPLGSGTIALLAASSAIGEELLFRGALQPMLGFWPTVIIFGILHGGFTPRLFAWTIFALLAGILLGWLADFTGNLLAPIVCHFTVNYWNLHALTADEDPVRDDEDTPRGGSRRDKDDRDDEDDEG